MSAISKPFGIHHAINNFLHLKKYIFYLTKINNNLSSKCVDTGQNPYNELMIYKMFEGSVPIE